MTVAELMTRNVRAIDQGGSLFQAIHLMTAHRLSGIPVVDSEARVVGILTEGDLLRRVELATDGDQPSWLASFFRRGHILTEYVKTHSRKVAELMTDQVVTIEDDQPLEEAVRLMLAHHVKRLPVTRQGRLCGILSRADLIGALGKALDALPTAADDVQIESAIQAAMAREEWADHSGTSFQVIDGVVLLDGCLFDMRQREAIEVLAGNIPGVVKVNNRIVCIDPNTGLIVYDPAAAP